jgi:hypothetical protein
MTSLTRELGSEQDVGEFGTTVAGSVADAYGRRPVEVHPAHLAELVEGAEALAGASAAPVR